MNLCRRARGWWLSWKHSWKLHICTHGCLSQPELSPGAHGSMADWPGTKERYLAHPATTGPSYFLEMSAFAPILRFQKNVSLGESNVRLVLFGTFRRPLLQTNDQGSGSLCCCHRCFHNLEGALPSHWALAVLPPGDLCKQIRFQNESFSSLPIYLFPSAITYVLWFELILGFGWHARARARACSRMRAGPRAYTHTMVSVWRPAVHIGCLQLSLSTF